mgnify:CR=1 FL=1
MTFFAPNPTATTPSRARPIVGTGDDDSAAAAVSGVGNPAWLRRGAGTAVAGCAALDGRRRDGLDHCASSRATRRPEPPRVHWSRRCPRCLLLVGAVGALAALDLLEIRLKADLADPQRPRVLRLRGTDDSSRIPGAIRYRRTETVGRNRRTTTAACPRCWQRCAAVPLCPSTSPESTMRERHDRRREPGKVVFFRSHCAFSMQIVLARSAARTATR